MLRSIILAAYLAAKLAAEGICKNNYTSYDLIKGCEIIEGNVRFKQNYSHCTDLVEMLKEVRGDLIVEGGACVRRFFPLLEKVLGSITLSGVANFHAHDTFPQLKYAKSLNLTNFSQTYLLEFQKLVVEKSIVLSNTDCALFGIVSAELDNLEVINYVPQYKFQLPKLGAIKGNVTLLNSISPDQMLPNLKAIGGSLKIAECSQESLELPFVSVGSDIIIRNCPSVNKISFKNLEIVKGEIHIEDIDQLNLFAIPKLKSVKSINLAVETKNLEFDHNIQWTEKSFFNSNSISLCHLTNPGAFRHKGDAPCNDLCHNSILLTIANFKEAQACQEIKGNLTLDEKSNLDKFSLQSLEKVHGSVIFDKFQSAMHFPLLRDIKGTLKLKESVFIHHFDKLRKLNKLEVLRCLNDGSLKFSNLNVEDSISIKESQMSQVSGIVSKNIKAIFVSGNPKLEMVEFPHLSSAENIEFKNNPKLKELSLSSLETANSIALTNSSLKVINLTLTYVNDSITIIGNQNLTSINFVNLKKVGTNLIISENEKLIDVSLPKLEMVENYLIINSTLEEVDISSLTYASSLTVGPKPKTIKLNPKIDWKQSATFNANNFCSDYSDQLSGKDYTTDTTCRPALCEETVEVSDTTAKLLSRCDIISGDLIFNRAYTSDYSLKAIKKISGNLIIANAMNSTIPLDNVMEIGGSLMISGDTFLPDGFLRNLESISNIIIKGPKVYNKLQFNHLTSLSNIDIKSTQLSQISGILGKSIIDVSIKDNPLLSVLTFDALESAVNVTLSENPRLRSTSKIFPQLEKVEGSLEYKNSGQYIHFNKLESVTEDLVISDKISYIIIPHLKNVGKLIVHSDKIIELIDLKELNHVTEELKINANTTFISLNKNLTWEGDAVLSGDNLCKDYRELIDSSHQPSPCSSALSNHFSALAKVTLVWTLFFAL